MSLDELHADLRRNNWRADTWRGLMERLDGADRELFFDLARNKPGPGRPVVNPEKNEFVWIEDVIDNGPHGLARSLAKAAGHYEVKRRMMFQNIIELVHSVAKDFNVYLGRTYCREDYEGFGIYQRWSAHHKHRRMRYARVCARVPRDHIQTDESFAIALVRLWEDYNALCSDNLIVGGGGNVADDEEQIIYMCLQRKGHSWNLR